jgi:flagellar motor switch protein FliM
MESILSQNEIDALLSGVEEGKVDTTPERKDNSGIKSFDFSNQDLIIRGRMLTLETLNDHFCRLIRNTLSSELRREIDVAPQGIQMVKFGEFIKTVPVPSSLHVFKMEPLRGHALMVMESKLVFTLLDIFFGGTGKTRYKVEGRDFTAIETKFITRLVAMVMGDLQKAWQTIHPITIQYVRGEINSQFVRIVHPSDLVIVMPYVVELDQVKGTMNVCIPYAVVEPIKAMLYSGFQSDRLEADQNWVGRLLDCLKGTEVEITVDLGQKEIKVRDLLNLKVGDTLVLDKEASDPLIARVQEVPKFLVSPGLYGTNKAAQFERRIKPR